MARNLSEQRIDNVYIAEGLADDFEELILKCSQVSKLSFEKFTDVWKEMDFSCIFHGRPSGAELAEYCEEALHIAKYYMVSNINNHFEKSVAGLFLLYSILNLQPYPRLVSVRMVQEDVHAVERLEHVARRERRHDILYILGEVLIRGPCQFHVSERERGLEYCLRKYFDGASQHSMLGRKPIGVFHRHNEELDIIKEMCYFEDRYDRAKRQILIKGTTEPDRSLGYSNSRLARDLQNSLKSVVSGVVLQDSSRADAAAAGPKSPDRLDAVQAVKNKAMKNVVNPMKHLTGIEDRIAKPEASPSTTKTQKSYKKPASERYRKKSDSSGSPLKSPKPYPWSLKLFNEFEAEDPSTSNHKPYSHVLRTSPRVKKASTSEPRPPAQSWPMMLIETEPEDLTNRNGKDPNQPNAPESFVRQSPRKNTTPRRTRILDDSSDQEQTATLTPKSKLKKSDTNPTESVTNAEPQFIELTLDEIPIEFSSENNNVEIEIIDLYNGKDDMNTITFDNSRVKEIKTYKNSKKNKVIKIEPSTTEKNETSCEVKSKASNSELKNNANQSEVILSNEPSTSKRTAVKSSSKRKLVKSNESSLKLDSNENQSEVFISNEASTSKTSQKRKAVKSNISSPRRKQVKANESSPKVKENESSPKVKENESSPKVESNMNQSEVIISIEPSTSKTTQKGIAVESNKSSPRRKQVIENESSSQVNSNVTQKTSLRTLRNK